MAKYQFFCIPDSKRREFTYINMESDTYLAEKKQLLQSGFEVEDDVIYAKTPEEAVEKFRSNYIYALDEYNNSYPEGGLIKFMIESYQEIRRKLGKR
ncbi:hypothetical protein [Photobacterium sp. R1]